MLIVKIDGDMHVIGEVGDPTLCGIDVDYSTHRTIGKDISASELRGDGLCEECQAEAHRMSHTIILKSKATIEDVDEITRELGYDS